MGKKLTLEEATNVITNKILINNIVIDTNDGKLQYYSNGKTKIPLLCHCGNKYESSYESIKYNGTIGCKICKYKSVGMKNKLSLNEVNKIVLDKIKTTNLKINTKSGFVEKYETCETKIPLLCACGDEYKITMSYLYTRNTYGCPSCIAKNRGLKLRNELDEVNKKVLEVLKDTNIFVDTIDGTVLEYNDHKTYIPLKCSCGISYKKTYNKLTTDGTNGCYSCSTKESIQLRYIDTLLKEFTVENEKRFVDCRNKLPLPFDRYIVDLNILIEYDGEQHFKSVVHWGGEKEYESRKLHDKIKSDYAIKNGYNFIRISYSQDAVKELNDYIKIVQENKNKQIIKIYDNLTII